MSGCWTQNCLQEEQLALQAASPPSHHPSQRDKLCVGPPPRPPLRAHVRAQPQAPAALHLVACTQALLVVVFLFFFFFLVVFVF